MSNGEDDARAAEAFQRFQELSFHDGDLGVAIDISRVAATVDAVWALEKPMAAAFAAMAALEGGAIANPDEQRMVGHYWLRAPELAPEPELRAAIEAARAQTAELAAAVRSGTLAPERGGRFRRVFLVGIGGSALGPQLLCDALAAPDGLELSFVDNTDPDGIDRLLSRVGSELAQSLTVVVSKSGGTKETRNGMLELQHAYQQAGLELGKHAVAVTSRGSQLDEFATQRGFLAHLPMWDWVGGRTSVMSAVGLLPAALAGADVDALLDGAARMDASTRNKRMAHNPAALLAAAWYVCGAGGGEKDMVVVPYKDRLQLVSRYLQQLVMESLGKRDDLDGLRVHQGLTVYGNKGSTDQHAYVQQLLDGPDNFFLTFIEVLRDRNGDGIEVEPGVSSGDYLSGFLHGTRRALSDRGRESLLVTLDTLDATSLGALIALYERAVGLYASLVNINAYHQPGVESGKRAASEYLQQLTAIRSWLREHPGAHDVHAVANGVGTSDVEEVLRILRHLAANPRHAVSCELGDGAPLWEARFAAD